MNISLRISGVMYDELQHHLFPGDECESVAVALCGYTKHEDSLVILVHQIIPIPVEDCILRTPTTVHWKTNRLIDVLEISARKNLAILKIHSHPNGYPSFSEVDDASDKELFTSTFSWIDDVECHVSAVMLPSGEIFARAFKPDLSFQMIDRIAIVGDDIKYFGADCRNNKVDDFNIRTAQAFGNGTTALLKSLSVAVVGCSGTGSPTVEQLMRLGFGKILLVDPDRIERKNLNRILNSTAEDADFKRYKVDVLKERIVATGLGTVVEAYPVNLYDDVTVINKLVQCDVLIGCMDSVDGRYLLNAIATFYLIPYIDIGVKLIADGKGSVEQIWSTIHYLQPGKSSLFTRRVFNLEDLNAASLFRADPDRYKALKKEGYIKNVDVESPAVISVNMQAASLAIIELLARLHKFRYEQNASSAITRVSLTDMYVQTDTEAEVDKYLEKFVGRGDMMPFLNMPEFLI